MAPQPCNTRTVEAPSAAWTSDTAKLVMGPRPVQVIGSDPNRRSVAITLDVGATADVFVVSSQSATEATGYRLTPGAGIVLNTSAAVYVISPTGSATVYVVAETGSIG